MKKNEIEVIIQISFLFFILIIKTQSPTIKLKVNNENEAGAWFTLDGRRLASKPTQRGVYIVGGKKMAVK